MATKIHQSFALFILLCCYKETTAQSGGATYVRWGHTACPTVTGTEPVYIGVAGGSLFNQVGGASNYLCMPTDPEYTLGQINTVSRSPIHEVEYGGRRSLQPMIQPNKRAIQGTNNPNVPCAVCRVSTRPTVVMIPAKVNCPSSWTREYFGFLMGGQKTDKRTTFECVDQAMQSLPSSLTNTVDGAFFYDTEATCNSGLPCPLYIDKQPLNCVVCTK